MIFVEKKEDPLLKGIKEGTIYAMKAVALKDSFDNLKFCPEREECKVLQENMRWINTTEELVRELHCPFYESEDWIIVGITKHGTMVTATMKKEQAEALNEAIDETRL